MKENLINNLNDIKKYKEVKLTKHNIKNTTWVNNIFSKIINIYNFSNLCNSKSVDLLGNGVSLKKYNFKK